MKKTGWRKYIMVMLAVMLTALTWFGVTKVAAAVQNLEEITAYYVGEALEVGQKINIKDVHVMASYTIYDGYTTNYDFSDVKT